jgi:hypothetical protein
LLYSAKPSFIIEEEIKTFYDKQKPQQFIAAKPAPQNILCTEKEAKCNQENKFHQMSR